MDKHLSLQKDKLYCLETSHDSRCEEKVKMDVTHDENAGNCVLNSVDSSYVVSFVDVSHDADQLSPKHLKLSMRASAGITGGRLWSSSHQLASFVFAHRRALIDKDVLELGCGLGLPSLVASHFAAKVVASDCNHTVIENMCNASRDLNPAASKVLSAKHLNFVDAGGMSAAGLHCWDVVLFAECIYHNEMGVALPRALSALLKPSGIAVGALPTSERNGLEEFWAGLEKAGLSWQVPTCWTDRSGDGGCGIERQGRLYVFFKSDGLDLVEEAESDAESVAPLFDDV